MLQRLFSLFQGSKNQLCYTFLLSVTVENYNSLQKWIYYLWEKEWSSVISDSFVRSLSTSNTYAILCVCAGFCQSARGFWVSESNPLIPSFYVPVLWSVLLKKKKVGLISVWLLVKGKGLKSFILITKVHIFWEGQNFCKISTLLLSVCNVDKSKVEFCGLFRIYEL